jgi:1,4-dihydroxy-2-naphthoate octaprenyltransferase
MKVLNRFFNYVEIRTKIASLLPFLLGLFYTMDAYGQIKTENTLLFFISMLFFDMATTALNNYIDTKTNHTPLPFSKKTAKLIFIVLFSVAVGFGVTLVFYTGLAVLFCGALCFAIGILYTFGPAPISRMPLGEAFSGVFMGFFIPLLTVLINAPATSLMYFFYQNGSLQINLHLAGLLRLSVVTIPAVCGIANIMLANNICDLASDIQVNRFTLPFYIGRKRAVSLFAALYYTAYGSIVCMAAFGIFPLYVLLALLTVIVVYKNISIFRKSQSKKDTFPLSVQNFILLMLPLIIIAAIGAIYP